MGHDRIADHELIDLLLQDPVGVRDALVLPQMFEPRLDQERLQEPPRFREVLEDPPRIRAIRAPFMRLSTISATAPAGIANRNIGSVVATCTSDTSKGSAWNPVISHAAAALYIQDPMFATTVAVQDAERPVTKGTPV